MKHLDCILKPNSIAVIGASRRENSIGWQIVDNLLAHGFAGPVYPINPSAASIHSITAYPSIGDVPGPVELAIVVVPGEFVNDVARQCVEAGVKGLVVISAGFKEVGGAGIERERELLATLQGTEVRTVGPNCMGVINTHPAVRMNATFAPAMPPPGPVGFISQSGAMGLSILDYAESLGIGMSQFVSSGNKMDISGNDLLEYWQHDPHTKLVLMYIENFGDPPRFVQLGRAITREKPVFIVKSGRTGAGARAAASHTGALGQTDLATDALIAQAGAIRAQTVNELFDLAMAFANQPLPVGNRVAIVTNAGGPGIIIADACEAHGLATPAFADDTKAKLRARLPDEASVQNPVDLIASATPERYEFALDCVMEDSGIDAAIAAFVPPLGTQTQDIAEAIVRVNGKHPAKPMLAVLMGKQGLPAGLAELHDAHIPAYLFPEPAARALGAMWRYVGERDRPQGQHVAFATDDEAVSAIIDATLARGQEKLTEADALRVLEAYGIPVVPWAFVPMADESAFAAQVVAAAETLTYPVAIKIVSPQITHKTDVGGVVLGLDGPDEVQSAITAMLASVSRVSGAAVDGVVVQRMAAKGRETIVGLTRIPGVGPMVMFGLGGVYVEVLRDVVLRLCPLLDTDATEMIGQVKMHKLLEGVRGEASSDRDALAETVLRIAQLAGRHQRVVEMDINPLVSYEQGAVAIDARIQINRD
ncbi:MAG: acetate--CoA ligase family protein [Gemmatimonadales bacterium]